MLRRNPIWVVANLAMPAHSPSRPQFRRRGLSDSTRKAGSLGGKISTAGMDSLLGEVKINLSENKVYWQGYEVAFIRKQGDRFWFFAPGS